jgi:hypothetical protein
MWKKADQLPSTLDSASNSADPISEEVGRMLMAVVSKSTREQEQVASVSKPEVAQELQFLSATTIREYAQTLEKCTKSASEYLRCASLLFEARDSYDKLRRLSDEIRKLLDTEEMKLRSLMDQVQKTANGDSPGISGQSVLERRGPESSKAENVIANGEKPRVTRFP